MPPIATRPPAELARARLAELPFMRQAPCRHGSMLYNRNDIYVGRSLELYGEYIEQEAAIYAQILAAGAVVVEAGANIGALTLPIARRIGAKGRIHAFEPQPFVHATLFANLELNGLLDRVTAYRAGLGAAPGIRYLPAADPAESENFGGVALSEDPAAGVAVPVMTVDQLKLDRCDLLKIDVQGMEREVLVGATRTIARHQPLIYVENDHADHSPALIRHLLRLGYRLYWHIPALFSADNFRGHKENLFGPTINVNMLCLPQKDRREVRLPRITSPADWWRQLDITVPVDGGAAPARAGAPPGAGGTGADGREGRQAFEAAIAAHQAGRVEEALRHYDQAIVHGYNPSGAFTNIGVLLRQQKRFAAAAIAHRRALELAPGDPSVMGNLGNALKDAGRFEEAIQLKRRVVELRGPADAESRHGLGIALRDAGRIEEACDVFEQAARLKPDDAEIRFNLALAQLHLERFEQGWINYEYRWQLDRHKKRAFRQPWWQGEDLAGKTLLIFAEQGFGDTIQFIRFVPAIKAKGARVILECQKELARLIVSAPGLDEIVIRDTPEAEQVLERVDVVCPLASLMRYAAVDLTRLPGPVPYLAPPPGLGARFDALLARGGDRLKVGIVWSGSITFTDNANRSAGLDPYLRFAEIPGVQLYGLQKGPRLDELKALGTDSLIIDASPLLGDFADTAALIQRLDLVLMTDSSVVHLTGALGRPVWVMLMHHPDWRWLKERLDSPWYPSARLFRQRTPRDWEHVFAEVAGELAALARGRGTAPALGSQPAPVPTPLPSLQAPPPSAPLPSAPPAAAPLPVVPPAAAPDSAALEIEIEIEPPAPPRPAPPPAEELLLPSILKDAAGRPRFVMPIPRPFLKDAGLRVLAREEQEEGGFEYATRRFLDEHLLPGDLFIDVGAHWGIYSLTAATRHPGAVRVLAIEASPLNVEHLRRWVGHNRQEAAIEVIAAGAADREGFASVAPQSTMGHHIEALSDRAEGQGIRIPTTTLDRLIADRPDLQARRVLMKIDVEGLEPEVLLGARTLLGSGRVAALIFEKGRSFNTPPGRIRWQKLLDDLGAQGFGLWRMPHENMGGPLVPYAVNDNLCNVFALRAGFERRPDYAKPFGTTPAPFRLPSRPSEQEQVAATEALIAVRGVDVERWAVPDQGAAADLRARLAAAMIPAGARVLDLGAGAMLLRAQLEPGCHYRPLDLFPFAADMEIADLERMPAERIGAADVAALLAVLEYLHDPARLLRLLRPQVPRLIVTYPFVTAGDGPRQRRRRGLVNYIDAAGWNALLAAGGWHERQRAPLADGASLMLLEADGTKA